MQNVKTRILVEGAAMAALSTVLSFIPLYQMPWGGTVTLLSMLPVTVFSIRRGAKWGFAVAFVYSLIQFAQGVMKGLFGWGLTPAMLAACILLDYIAAFTVLGAAGSFRRKKLPGWIGGIVLAAGLRFLMHFLSGVFIWKSVGELWEGFSTDNTCLYSFLYNGCYMLPEMVLTVVGAAALLKAPQTKKLLLSE